MATCPGVARTAPAWWRPSITDKTGRGRIAFHLLHLPLLDFLITTLCGFWEKETPGRRGRLTLLFPVRECVRALGHSRKAPSSNHPTPNAQRSAGLQRPPTESSAVTSKGHRPAVRLPSQDGQIHKQQPGRMKRTSCLSYPCICEGLSF